MRETVMLLIVRGVWWFEVGAEARRDHGAPLRITIHDAANMRETARDGDIAADDEPATESSRGSGAEA